MTTPDLEIYPDEMSKIAVVMTRLSNAFDFSHLSERTKAIFETAAREEFAKIGFQINLRWEEVMRRKGLMDDEVEPTGVWLPQVEPCARLRPEVETDHDRVRWGVVKGLADGQPGYVRADGRKTEDPIKKTFQ